MSRSRKQILGSLVVCIAVTTLSAAALIAKGTWRDDVAPQVREILLEARGTAFSGSNPTVEARVGERLRFVAKNTDPGVVHSFSVPSLSPEVKIVQPGTTEILEVTLTTPGTYDYVCPHHCPLMRGKLVVRP